MISDTGDAHEVTVLLLIETRTGVSKGKIGRRVTFQLLKCDLNVVTSQFDDGGRYAKAFTAVVAVRVRVLTRI